MEKERDEDTSVDASILDQLKKLGAPAALVSELQERVASVEGAEEDETFELWSDALEAWGFFMSLCRLGQWEHIVGAAAVFRNGIPTERVLATMELKGVPTNRRSELFADIEELIYAVREADALVFKIRKDRK